MRSELKSYSNLIDNKKGVNNFMSAIDKLTSGTNSMYLCKLYTLFKCAILIKIDKLQNKTLKI